MIVAVRRGAVSFRSESGLIGVGAVIGIAILVLGIYLLIAAFKGDPAYYGSVPVPSQEAPIDLDGGEVDISFAERVETDSLTPPEDLSYSVTTVGGEPLETSTRTATAEDSDAGAAQLIDAVDVPEDGTYLVTAEASSAAARAEPALAFGLSPTGAVRVRFEQVIDELNGPTGIVVLVALGLLFVIPRARVAHRRNKSSWDDTGH